MKARNEMNPEFMWDFSHIYENDAAWEAACEEALVAIDKVPTVAGTLSDSPEAMKKGIGLMCDAEEKVMLCYLYTMLKKSSDASDPAFQAMEAKAMGLLVKLQSAAAFLNPEIVSIPADRFEELIGSPILADEVFALKKIVKASAHTLSADKELMLAKLADAAQTPDNAFSMLNNVDLVFPTIKDENGNDVQLSNGNFSVYRESTVRSVREAAFNAYFGTFKKFENTIAELYGGSVKLDCYFADVRGYESARAAALFNNDVPETVYDSLIDAVHDSLPYMRKYLELRKKALKLEKIDMFDLYAPMMEDVDFNMPYESGKALVKEALKPLGEEYGKLLDEAYENHWIDVYENKGKRSGAFSCGVYGVHPYVLLNYTDTLDDAFTLAHELGHAMHSYKSSEAQSFLNHNYSIMVAEVASTVNEVLLTLHLLKTETDKKRRAYVLNHFLESFRTTLYRQTLFAEFERESHRMCAEGVPLTAQNFSELYKSLISKYYEGAEINEIMANEWSYIPHFYNAFYVYQYATGFSSAVAIAKQIVETGDATGYLKFLTLGGSDYPIEELKVAGIDLTKPETVKNALELFGSTIDELSALIDEIK
ncbi:MAG: oligoendopeptidase F [Clostridia bacterium]|nr:oligoendopeptidase F [Clostridia bacterium]